jgi:hypothetical protein
MALKSDVSRATKLAIANGEKAMELKQALIR